jgi:hypothetical protein
MSTPQLRTDEELDLGILGGGCQVKRLWLVQGNLPVPFPYAGKATTAPYRVAVDLAEVPRNYLARLIFSDETVGSPAQWCARELPPICEWLVQAQGVQLAGGGEVEDAVVPLSALAPGVTLDPRASLGKTSLLPGAGFYLLNHAGYSKWRWSGEREALPVPSFSH